MLAAPLLVVGTLVKSMDRVQEPNTVLHWPASTWWPTQQGAVLSTAALTNALTNCCMLNMGIDDCSHASSNSNY